MKDKTKLLVMKIGGALLALGIILFLVTVAAEEMIQGTLTPVFIVAAIPAVAIIALLIIMIRKQGLGVKSGLPLHDEMSNRIKQRAGYYSYLVTIYFLLALMWYHFLADDSGLPPILGEHIAIGTMIFMFLVFGAAYIIIKRRGIK